MEDNYKNNIILLIVIGIVSILIAWGIVKTQANFKFLLFIIISASIIVILCVRRNSLLIGFVFWIYFFVLGYRTIHITSYFSIHPLIVLLTLLFIIFVITSRITKVYRFKFPKLLLFFIPFWFWGFIPGLINRISFSNMLADSINFFYLIPLFLVISYLSSKQRFWKLASISFLTAGIIICLIGSIEHFFPNFKNILPGFIQIESEGSLSPLGFHRASFSFFGTEAATVISALALPMLWVVPYYYKNLTAKLVTFFALLILLLGIYISGTREAWLFVLITSLLMAYMNFKVIGIAIVGSFWTIISRFFPTEAWNLIYSLITPFTTGQIIDTSLRKRVFRQENAFQLILHNPQGVGWSGSGWVHGDFTQVAANLGIFAGIVFLLWYVNTLYQAIKYLKKNSTNRLFQALFVSFVLCGIVLLTEGVEVLTQFIMPVWFIWGLVEAYLQNENKSEKDEYRNGPTIYSSSHV